MAATQLSDRDRKTLDRLCTDCSTLFGHTLRAVILYGEAAGVAYRPRTTPLTTIVVVDLVGLDVLQRMRRYLGRWMWRPLPTPLLMDPAYIGRAQDAFPLEFLEIRDLHRLLLGDGDPFGEIRIAQAHLRLEIEEQLRGKLLHLQQAYVEAGRSHRRLAELMLASVVGFETVLRGAAHLARGDAPADPGELLARVEEAFELRLPTLKRLRRVRRGIERLPRGEIEATFASYLEEVERLTVLADRLANDGEAAPNSAPP